MAKFGDKLKALRVSRDLTQEELAGILGTTKQVISRYENNQRSPKIDVVLEYSERLGVPIDYLADNSTPAMSGILPLPIMRSVPLLGTIACGEPILAAENIEGEVSMPEHVRADFALRCKGDSMINARIYDGDIVYIRQQPTVDDGQIAAVLIDDEATLKRVRLFPDHIVLEPENPQFRPLSYWEADMERVKILGLAVAFTSSII